jgi:hypothetical protein
VPPTFLLAAAIGRCRKRWLRLWHSGSSRRSALLRRRLRGRGRGHRRLRRGRGRDRRLRTLGRLCRCAANVCVVLRTTLLLPPRSVHHPRRGPRCSSGRHRGGGTGAAAQRRLLKGHHGVRGRGGGWGWGGGGGYRSVPTTPPAAGGVIGGKHLGQWHRTAKWGDELSGEECGERERGKAVG